MSSLGGDIPTEKHPGMWSLLRTVSFRFRNLMQRAKNKSWLTGEWEQLVAKKADDDYGGSRRLESHSRVACGSACTSRTTLIETSVSSDATIEERA